MNAAVILIAHLRICVMILRPIKSSSAQVQGSWMQNEKAFSVSSSQTSLDIALSVQCGTPRGNATRVSPVPDNSTQEENLFPRLMEDLMNLLQSVPRDKMLKSGFIPSAHRILTWKRILGGLLSAIIQWRTCWLTQFFQLHTFVPFSTLADQEHFPFALLFGKRLEDLHFYQQLCTHQPRGWWETLLHITSQVLRGMAPGHDTKIARTQVHIGRDSITITEAVKHCDSKLSWM